MPYQASRPHPSSIISVLYEHKRCLNWFVANARLSLAYIAVALRLIVDSSSVILGIVHETRLTVVNCRNLSPCPRPRLRHSRVTTGR